MQEPTESNCMLTLSNAAMAVIALIDPMATRRKRNGRRKERAAAMGPSSADAPRVGRTLLRQELYCACSGSSSSAVHLHFSTTLPPTTVGLTHAVQTVCLSSIDILRVVSQYCVA